VTVPAATALTTPVEDTVASAVFEDCHVASEVTSFVVPSDIVATAVNCELPPIDGVDPDTVIDDTTDDDGRTVTAVGDVVPLHAAASAASPTVRASEAIARTMNAVLRREGTRPKSNHALTGPAPAWGVAVCP
jgi:hypothetical protein